jgi:hypothetical protein
VSRAPHSISQRALRAPARRTTNGAICAGATPSVTSGIANFASSAAITRSQAAASPQPPPIALPVTTATLATGSDAIRSSMAPNCRL